MTDQQKNKKDYEPPKVKEIGGIYEQAMGISRCRTGGVFAASCRAGNRASSCLAGSTPGPGTSCSMGNPV
mgnify:CR=1 FL=1